MEDVNAIHRIFKNLKYEMDNNGWVYQWHLGDEPIKVTHKFYPRAFQVLCKQKKLI